jgi:hypothetical protein
LLLLLPLLLLLLLLLSLGCSALLPELMLLQA